MIHLLQQWAGERGFRLACGDIGVLHEVRLELDNRKLAGELNDAFYRDNLTFFRYEKSAESIASPKAVVVVAMPRPAHRLSFETGGGTLEVILPPTYVGYSALFSKNRDDIITAIPQLAGHLEILVAPLKAVASRLGLVAYGRNNITYIPEWGSYFQLVGYLSDADLGISPEWRPQPPQLMPECEACGICAAVCPTGAITEERVLLHAENCTTLFSERTGELDHELSANCLFGCLECQEICPVNTGRLRVVPAEVSFDRAETEAILGGCGNASTPEAITASRKLASLGLTEAPLLGRNLAHLI